MPGLIVSLRVRDDIRLGTKKKKKQSTRGKGRGQTLLEINVKTSTAEGASERGVIIHTIKSPDWSIWSMGGLAPIALYRGEVENNKKIKIYRSPGKDIYFGVYDYIR